MTYPDETTGDANEAHWLAGIEADMEMAEMAAVGNRIAYQRRQGVCCHQSAVGYLPEPCYPEQEGLKPGQLRCTDGCGQVFDSDEGWYAAMDAAIGS